MYYITFGKLINVKEKNEFVVSFSPDLSSSNCLNNEMFSSVVHYNCYLIEGYSLVDVFLWLMTLCNYLF